MIRNGKSKFVKIQCDRCGARQIIFGRSSTRIKCRMCNKLLIKVTGGKVKVKTFVREVLHII